MKFRLGVMIVMSCFLTCGATSTTVQEKQEQEMSAEFRALIDALQQEQLTENRKNNYRKACIAGAASVSALVLAAAVYWLKVHATSLENNDFWGSRDERNDLHLDVPERSISDE